MLDIGPYLPYYIGSRCIFYLADESPDGFESKITIDEIKRHFDDPDETMIRPILYRLEDMTERQMIECYTQGGQRGNPFNVPVKSACFGNTPNIVNIKYEGNYRSTGFSTGEVMMYLNQLDAKQFQYLLKEGFWLWGNHWFEYNMIIDATLESIKDQLIGMGEKLYEEFAATNPDPLDILQSIKWYINNLDVIISKYQNKSKIKEPLIKLRNDLYNDLPNPGSDSLDILSLLNKSKFHFEKMNNLIDTIHK